MSEQEHLTLEQYESLLESEPPPRSLVRQLLEHLLARCPDCRRQWHPSAEDAGGEQAASDEESADDPARAAAPAPSQGAPAPSQGENLEEPVQRALGRARDMKDRIDREKRLAEKAYRELQALDHYEHQVQRIRRSERYQSWSLCEILMREGRQASFRDPARSQELASLAIETAWTLSATEYGAPAVSDLLARGWALLANARRVGSDLVHAEETFHMAYFFLQHGTGEPLVAAEVMSYEASLRRDQRRFDAALRLLDQLIVTYTKAAEPHKAGRTYMLKSTVLLEADDSNAAEALAVLEKSLELIDGEQDRRLELCCRHAWVRMILKTGRPQEALRQLNKIRSFYDEFEEFSCQLRRRWLEGEIFEALDDLEGAESAYREVRFGFIQKGIGYDAALVSLQLAALYAAQGRIQEMKQLAEEMLPIFHSRDVHREANAALMLFRRAVQLETATVKSVRSIVLYLERARHNPGLRMETPS